jgi:hypothetical protein
VANSALEIDLIRQRLRNQKLARSDVYTPAKAVTWLGAIQAQDYPAAKWALGLRVSDTTDADVEQAFDEGTILRTHFLRPTWHFVTPADIRWMLKLSAPRVHAANAPYYRKLGLDDRLFARSRATLERALEGGRQLTRSELASALQHAGVQADGMRLAYLMMHAELDQVICSGARRGRQFTYALLEERVPRVPALERDEALTELTRRYFSSRGPATVRDYVWWSGLTVRDARAGIEMAGSALAHEVIDGRTHWFAPSRAAVRQVRRSAPAVYLLPNYDEYGIAYKDRDVIPSVPRPRRLDGKDEFAHLLAINGGLVGRWRRTLTASAVVVEAQVFRSLTRSESAALDASVARYGRFLNVRATLAVV